jgi:hypothetical protein
MSLSPLIHFGTSTWAYEGWQGIVYHKPYPKKRFKQDCLAEYASYKYQDERLFRTVGFDFTFYGPPSSELLRHYAARLPIGFLACTKVWEEITVPVFPSGLLYRKKAGPNPHFLDVEYFLDTWCCRHSMKPLEITQGRSYLSSNEAASSQQTSSLNWTPFSPASRSGMNMGSKCGLHRC